MSTCQQHLWHCLNTNKAITLVDFYNKLGLALRPLKSRDNHIYVSTVAPLCISEKHDYPDKNVFVWSEQMCSEFERAFNPIQQTVCQNLAQVEVQNTCNFNSIVRCPDLNQARSHFTDRYKWIREKHGLGPMHFHTSVGVHQVEIYPIGKQQTNKQMNLDFYFDISSMEVIPPELQTQDRTYWSLQDPEGRTFIVGLSKINKSNVHLVL